MKYSATRSRRNLFPKWSRMWMERLSFLVIIEKKPVKLELALVQEYTAKNLGNGKKLDNNWMEEYTIRTHNVCAFIECRCGASHFQSIRLSSRSRVKSPWFIWTHFECVICLKVSSFASFWANFSLHHCDIPLDICNFPNDLIYVREWQIDAIALVFTLWCLDWLNYCHSASMWRYSQL